MKSCLRRGASPVRCAAQAICASYAWPYLTNGQLLDADSYSWLGHVQRLLDTGHWFDHMQPRANWPFGELQHSSRPFDALLLAGAFILSPFFGTEKVADGFLVSIFLIIFVAIFLGLIKRKDAP